MLVYAQDEMDSHCLHQLFDLLVQTTNIGVGLGGPLIHLHRLYARVVLGRQLVQNQVRVLVDANEVSRRQLVVGNKADNGQEDSLTLAMRLFWYHSPVALTS